MTLDRKIITALIATSALAFGLPSSAEPGTGCDGMGPQGMRMQGMQGMAGDPAARAEQHLAKLKGELKITPQQEPLWQAYADKIKSEAGQGMKAMRERADNPATTAPERMARMAGAMKERAAAMEAVNASFRQLYDALTPEQKTIADQRVARMGPMHGRGEMPRGPRGPGAEPGRG